MSKYKIKKVCCIGAGYVGGPTMIVFANKCPHIEFKVVDINASRIRYWNSEDFSNLPIYEPGLDQLLKKCRNKNLFFTTDIAISIAEADMIFLSVNTPTKTKGVGAGKASDLKWVEASARQIAKYAKNHTIVVEKSTLPVRTAETIEKILDSSNLEQINNNKTKTFSVLSNPEFLSEGNAINDLEFPDRVLIGGANEQAIDALENLYTRWVSKEKILRTSLWSSELSKLAANAFLAQRISSINSISAFCEETGADIQQVSKGIGTDSRIGNKFLMASPGFGGSCFQKDILNLVYLCEFYKLNEVANYWQGVVDINNWQKRRIAKLIVDKLFGNVSEKKISILGFSFKANTNDTRNSPAIDICNDLIENGAKLSIYDPKVSKEQIHIDLDKNPKYQRNDNDKGDWSFCESIEEATQNSHAIIVLTEWEEFKNIDLKKLFKMMNKPSWIFDTRFTIDRSKAINAGFNYWSLGF